MLETPDATGIKLGAGLQGGLTDLSGQSNSGGFYGGAECWLHSRFGCRDPAQLLPARAAGLKAKNPPIYLTPCKVKVVLKAALLYLWLLSHVLVYPVFGFNLSIF